MVNFNMFFLLITISIQYFLPIPDAPLLIVSTNISTIVDIDSFSLHPLFPKLA